MLKYEIIASEKKDFKCSSCDVYVKNLVGIRVLNDKSVELHTTFFCSICGMRDTFKPNILLKPEALLYIADETRKTQTNILNNTFEINNTNCYTSKDKNKTWFAKGLFEDPKKGNKFRVLQDSWTKRKIKINSSDKPEYKESKKNGLNTIQKLLKNKKVIKVGDKFIFQKDVVFDFPSRAGMVLSGRSTNNKTWNIDRNNKKYYQTQIKKKNEFLPNSQHQIKINSIYKVKRKHCIAKGYYKLNKFIILKDSWTNKKIIWNSHDSDSYKKLKNKILELRNNLLRQNVLKEMGGKLIFESNFKFNSSSQAAGILNGSPLNGKIYFK